MISRCVPGSPGSVRRVGASLVGVLLAGIVSLLVTPGSALGASVSRGPGYPTSVTYLGIEVIDGVRVVCIDSSAASPTGLQPGSAVSDPRIAYLLDRYTSTTSNATAAALAYLVKKKYDSNAGAADVALQARPEASQIRAAIARLNADAAANAGPYLATAQITATSGTVPTKGTVSGIAVRQTDGSYAALPGVAITVTLSGPAAFDATGTRVRVVASTGSPQAAAWHATGEGAVSVTARATGLPPTTFVVHRKQAPGYQRVVSPTTTPGTATGQARLAGVVTARYSPTVATQIRSSSVLGPNRSIPVSDQVTVRGAQPRSTVSVTVTYYWTPARPVRSTTVPPSALKLGDNPVAVSTDSTGTGRAEAPGPDVTQTWGWVSAVESIATTAGTEGFRSDFGVASESTQLPERPTVTTMLQSQPVSPGRVDLIDRVTVTGAHPNGAVRVEVPIYLDAVRPTPSSTLPSTATLAGTASVLVATDAAGTGSASATLRGVTVTHNSWAVGMERIPAAAATATTPAVMAYQAPYGQSTESTQLCRPAPSTQLQQQLLRGGTHVRLVDRVTVSGACPNSVVRVVVPFYLDTAPPMPGPTVPATAHLVGSVTVPVTTDSHGNGTATATGPEIAVPRTTTVWAVGRERIEGLPGTSTGPAIVGSEALYGQASETIQIIGPGSASATPGDRPATALLNAGVPGDGSGWPQLGGAAVFALAGAVAGGRALRGRSTRTGRGDDPLAT